MSRNAGCHEPNDRNHGKGQHGAPLERPTPPGCNWVKHTGTALNLNFGFLVGRIGRMNIPFFKDIKIGAYLIKQKLLGRKRYPLVLMLEPLFRCNLACSGCGKIDYPDPILNRRLSVDECLAAVDECGAPMVAIPGGEPLIHKDIGAIVKGIVARKKFVSLCTNALLLEKKLDRVRALALSVLLGPPRRAQAASRQIGVSGRRVRPRRLRDQGREGARVHGQCQRHDFRRPSCRRPCGVFSTSQRSLGVGVSISPGYAYERAPDQEHFLSRRRTKELFRRVFALGRGKGWKLMHSTLFLDFLAGNQNFRCTPWGMPTRNIFGWQKPCYLLGEGYAKSFTELMETTDWDAYGTGRYEKCANCMAHCGYEPTAVDAMFSRPLEALRVAMKGVRTEGPMAPEIPLDEQRPAALRVLTPRREDPHADRADQGSGQGTGGSALAPAGPPSCRARGERASAAAADDAAATAAPPARRRCPRDGWQPMAAGGRARSNGSVTTRNAANGRRCSAAMRAAICDSVSTAMRSGLFVERALGGGAGDRLVPPQDIAEADMPRCRLAIARAAHGFQQGLGPAAMTEIAAALRDDAAAR